MEHLFGALLGGGVTTSVFAQKLTDASGLPKLILDLRSLPEFEQGHVSGAQHILLAQLESHIEQLVIDKNSRIAVYCSTGETASKAAACLRQRGYQNVENVGNLINAQLRFTTSRH